MFNLKSRWLMLHCGIVVLGLFGGSFGAAEPSGNAIYERILRSTCKVIIPGRGSGTGWIADSERHLVITNYHVVGEKSYVDVVFPDYDKSGKVITDPVHYQNKNGSGYVTYRDSNRDLAIIRTKSIPRQANQMKLATEEIAQGDRIHTVGNPGASSALWVYTTGSIRSTASPFKETVGGQRFQAQMFAAQLPYNPGDSGGPVVNDKGELVGVNSLYKKDVRDFSLCVHVSEVQNILGRVSGGGTDPLSVAVKIRDQGIDYLRQGEYATAVELLNEAIRMDPSNHVSYNERGAAYTFLDKDLEAIRDFNRTIALNPKYAVAYRNRGAAHFRLGKLQEAVADFSQAIQLNDRYARAYRGRGDVYTKLGKTREAQEDYKKAIELEQASK